MRKCIIRYGSILGCVLMLMPSIALTEEFSDDEVIDEVVVTSTPLDKYLVTTSVITAEEIESMAAKNVADVLADVPGLNFDRGRKNTNTLYIRGAAASYTKIYIDGILVNSLARINSSSEVDLNQYPVDNIAKIEVIKGPAPVTYGTDAIGGMILITTKDGKGFTGSKISLSGGSDSTFRTNISTGGNTGKFNYFVNFGTENTSGYTDNAYQDGYYFNTKLNWQLSDASSLIFLGGLSHLNKGQPDRYDLRTGRLISSTSGFWPGLNQWQYKDWDKSTLSLNYLRKVNDKFDMDFRVFRYTENQVLQAHGSNYDPNSNMIAGWPENTLYPGGYDTSRWNVSPWESTVKGFEWKSNLKLGKINTLTFGFIYHDIDWNRGDNFSNTDPANPDNLVWSKFNNKRSGYFLQDNIVPNERTMVTLGVRHDKSEVTNSDGRNQDTTSTNPTVNVVYKLSDKNTMRASYGRTVSFPMLSQYFSTATGNPDLKPEKSDYYELGLKHEFNETTSGDIAFFHNEIKDRIDRAGRSDPYVNIDSTTIKGIEIGLNKKFSSRLSAFTNYTFLDTSTVSIYNGTNTELKYVPKHHFNYGLQYKWNNGYRANLTGHWITQRYTDDTGRGDTRDASLGTISNISGYHVMDFKLIRQMNENASWHLSVFNLLDKEYEDSLFVPAAGRTFLMGVDCKF